MARNFFHFLPINLSYSLLYISLGGYVPKKSEKNEKNKKNFKYFLVAESLYFSGFATFEELPETKK